jgi:hypothetical protein
MAKIQEDYRARPVKHLFRTTLLSLVGVLCLMCLCAFDAVSATPEKEAGSAKKADSAKEGGSAKEGKKLVPQTPVLDGGATSNQLHGGTDSTQLQGGTSSTLLQGSTQLNTLSLEDWQKMDLKGFTNQARLMPAIPATVRFAASKAKLDEKILKTVATRLDVPIEESPDGREQ